MSLQPDLFGVPVIHAVESSPTHEEKKQEVLRAGSSGVNSALTYRVETTGSQCDATRTRREGLEAAMENAGAMRTVMLRLYAERGDLTDKEMGRILNRVPSTISARRNELIKLGRVKAVDERKDVHSGVTCTTWGLRKIEITEGNGCEGW